jgi:hypothetical protein
MNILKKIFGGLRSDTGKPADNVNKDQKIRIQFEDFELKHFDISSIWEFAIDEEGEENQDETTLRPARNFTIADPSEGMLLVKTQFETVKGKKYFGFCSPAFEINFGKIQPYILTNREKLPFWFGMFQPEQEYLEKFYAQLNETANTLFPIKFKALTPTKGVKLEGLIEGFMYLSGDEMKILK